MPEPITPQTASSSTSTQPTASSSKQPGEKQKQTQQPTSTSQTPAAASTAAQGKKKEGKEAAGKSAKEEKKAKRAAAVAARGGAGGPPAAGPGAPSGGAVGKDGKGKESSKADRTGQDGTTTAAGIVRGDPAAGVVAGTTVATGATSIAAVSTLLFSHLPSSRPPSAIPSTSSHKHLHPLVYRLGLLLSTPSTWTTSSPAFQPQSPPLRGTNARTTALLLTFRQVILDHSWPPREMHRVLPAHLSPMIGFLDGCRPKGVAGGNVIRWLKAEINRVGTDESIRDESEQKRLIVEAIDNYLKERIELAGEVICSFATEKIRDGDTIVTYARSSLVEQVLLEAWKQMKEEDEEASFHVVVVDSGPLLEGKALLRTLTTHSIPCSYTLLSSLASIIPRASLVLLGTAALFSDGSLYSRAGTAAVAMLAKENRIPVVAACETYKFGERVLLDAVTGNELGDASSLLAQEEGDIPTHLTPIHLLYDLTPAALITAICSEVGFIPPSSVPTVISKPGEAAGF